VTKLPLLRIARSDSVDAVSDLIRRAVDAGASDLHFLPQETDLLVRMRVDGMLHDLEHVSESSAGSTVSRLKVLSQLDIADHQSAQTGASAWTTWTCASASFRPSPARA
jgi:type II secretory ATPase GspE/PulE/Tfp pilus assembly ATPase PilB-like protein